MREENIKEVLGGGIKFHEQLPRMKKEELVGMRFILRDGRIIDDWDGQWGTTEFALLMLQLPEDNKEVTTLCGGIAVVRQVRKLLKRGRLPGRIWCFLNLVEGDDGKSYYLLDWDNLPAPGEKTEVKAAPEAAS